MICRSVGDMTKNEESTYDSDLKRRPRRNLTKKKKNLQKSVSDEIEVMYNS